MITRLKYFFIKKNYFILLLVGILLYLYLDFTQLINYHNILSIISTIIILYIIVIFYINYQDTLFNKNAKISNKFNLQKYPNLNTDIDLLVCLSNMDYLYEINSIEYRNLLSSVDKFFYYYQNFFTTKNFKKQLYDNAYLESQNILNIINSYGITLNETDMSKINLAGISNLINCLNKIKMILSKYLTYMEINNNEDWLNKRIDLYSNPVYPDEILPYEVNNDKLNVY